MGCIGNVYVIFATWNIFIYMCFDRKIKLSQSLLEIQQNFVDFNGKVSYKVIELNVKNYEKNLSLG